MPAKVLVAKAGAANNARWFFSEALDIRDFCFRRDVAGPRGNRGDIAGLPFMQ